MEQRSRGPRRARAPSPDAPSPVEELRFASDNKTLLTLAQDGVATRWRLAAAPGERPRREDASLPGVATELVGHHGELSRSRAPSRDGARIITGADDHTARLWSSAPARPIATLRGHAGWVRSAAFAPGGARVITGSVDGSARVWSAEDGAPVTTLRGHGAPVTAVALSADGRWAATATQTGTIRRWRVDQDDEPLVLAGHGAVVWALAFSPDGRWLLSGGQDGVALLQPADGRGAPTRLDHDWRVHDVDYAADGMSIVTASGDQRARVWRLDAPGRPRATPRALQHDAEVASARLLDDGRVITTTYDDALWIWPSRGDASPRVIRGPALASTRVSADGRLAVTRHGQHGARAWALEPVALHASLWRSPGLCVAPQEREALLAETPAQARRSFAACEARERP
ncbi:MAG: WD40 repeat domain-containing protein [Myxococcales bacterium]|nr:WD40 repeat domain-containing protein [Myxococcales bacterium]